MWVCPACRFDGIFVHRCESLMAVFPSYLFPLGSRTGSRRSGGSTQIERDRVWSAFEWETVSISSTTKWRCVKMGLSMKLRVFAAFFGGIVTWTHRRSLRQAHSTRRVPFLQWEKILGLTWWAETERQCQTDEHGHLPTASQNQVSTEDENALVYGNQTPKCTVHNVLW